MSAYGTKKGRRYLHRRQAGRQAGRQPRHKAARTKELRRCTIRARDGRMRIEEDRGVGFKDSRHFTLRCWRDSRESIQGYEGRTEGRKEGPMPRLGMGCAGGDTGKGEVAFSV